jgi:hypothetical protein
MSKPVAYPASASCRAERIVRKAGTRSEQPYWLRLHSAWIARSVPYRELDLGLPINRMHDRLADPDVAQLR